MAESFSNRLNVAMAFRGGLQMMQTQIVSLLNGWILENAHGMWQN